MTRGVTAPARSWLYVPGDRPELLAKALRAPADAVVCDLEDAVVPAAKARARTAVAEVLAEPPAKPVVVRINAVGSPWARDDVAAMAQVRVAALRIPKVASTAEVRQVAAWLADAGVEVALQCLLESALGVERAYEIATAHPAVATISLGEADLRADLDARADAALAWPRARVVVASAAAGIDPPIQSVHTAIHDLDGLARSSRAGRDAGFGGRSCIHPEQVPIVNAAYTPDPSEVAAARELVAALTAAADVGAGVRVLDDGRFVDQAVARSARRVLSLADAEEEGT